MAKILQKKSMSAQTAEGITYLRLEELAANDELELTEDEFLILWLYKGVLALSLNHSNQGIFVVGNDVLTLNGINSIKISHLYDYSTVIGLVIGKTELSTAATEMNYVISSHPSLPQRLEVLDSPPSLYRYPDSIDLLYCIDLLITDFLTGNTSENSSLILTDLLRFLGQLSLLKVRQLSPTVANTSGVVIAAQVMDYIRWHLREATLAEIAAQLHYHPNYLSNLLVKTCGQTFKELLNAPRNAVGQTLLLTTDYSLTEIASMLGFHSYSGFYRSFYKKYHMSPERYREIFKRPELSLRGFELSIKRK